jgi:hypothetical protein
MFAHKRWLLVVLGALLSTTIFGCSFVTGDDEEGGGGMITTTQVVAALQKADGCDDLLEKIQADVIAKLDLEARRMLAEEQATYDGVVMRGTAQGGTGVGTSEEWVADSSNEAPAPSAAGAAGTGGSYAGEPAAAPGGTAGSGAVLDGGGEAATAADSTPSGHSETTTQVEGVDEADIVKIDEESQYIYLLHGNELFVLDAWEPAQTAVEGQLSIEGSPHEMFVRENAAVVFSSVYDEQGLLRGDTASASAGTVTPDGMYYDYYGYSPFTKITLIDVSDTSAPRVVREFYVEGEYLSSRRHDHIVRAVVQGGFRAPNFSASIDYTDPWGEPYSKADIEAQVKAWHERMVAAVRASELSDWLPLELERKNGEIEAVEPACDEVAGRVQKDYYAPSPGLTQYGMTNIFAFDLSDPEKDPGGAVILGEASEVYASAKVMLLAHNDWTWQDRGYDHERTALHRFDLHADITTNYIASGFVQGHIKDQFSLDEHAGYIRVATAVNNWGVMPLLMDGPAGADMAMTEEIVEPFEPDQTPDNRVITLKTDTDEGELVQTGITRALGKRGEEIKSVRFLGDVGYVVTFRNTDPLIAVDLSDPEAGDLPVLGELEIDGFSEYMHPMDEDHLLTIGRNTDTSGRDIGLLLQIFDISDPASPTRAHEHPYWQSGWSEANTNHKAFTYYGDRQLLAFPYASYSYPFLSTLEVFRVTVEAGFTQLGSIDHTSLLTATCPDPMYFDYYSCGRPEPEVRRGVFITGDEDNDGTDSDFVYSISYGGVMVHDLDDLTAPVAEVQLPAVNMDYYYGGGVVPMPMEEPGMFMDTAGAAGASGGIEPVALCGNGIIESPEQCDGVDLGGATCASLGEGAGTLACSADCTFDLSMCTPATR